MAGKGPGLTHLGQSAEPNRAVDPYYLFADPDPPVFLNADPDPASQNCAVALIFVKKNYVMMSTYAVFDPPSELFNGFLLTF